MKRIIAALAVVLLALVGTGAWLSQRSGPTIDSSAIAVGKQEAINFFTLDSADVQNNINAVLSLAANPFKKQYAAKATTIESGVTSEKLTIAATVPANSAGLEYEHGNAAIVVVAVDESISAPGVAAQSNRYRVRLHLSKLDGQWRVTQIQQVG